MKFSQEELNVLDEALCAYTNEVIEDDDIEREFDSVSDIKRVRNMLIKRIQKKIK